MTDAVLYDCKDGLARITLNRPDARNALNIAMCEALIAATRRARDDGARCVLVQGVGLVFCAGADLKERQGMGDDAVRARRLKSVAATVLLVTVKVAAVVVPAALNMVIAPVVLFSVTTVLRLVACVTVPPAPVA